MKVILRIFIVIVFCSLNQLANSEITSYVYVHLTANEAITPNKEIKLFIDVVSRFDIERSRLELELPQGINLISGEANWQGSLLKETPKEIEVTIKMGNVVSGKISARIVTSNYGTFEANLMIEKVQEPGLAARMRQSIIDVLTPKIQIRIYPRITSALTDDILLIKVEVTAKQNIKDISNARLLLKATDHLNILSKKITKISQIKPDSRQVFRYYIKTLKGGSGEIRAELSAAGIFPKSYSSSIKIAEPTQKDPN